MSLPLRSPDSSTFSALRRVGLTANISSFNNASNALPPRYRTAPRMRSSASMRSNDPDIRVSDTGFNRTVKLYGQFSAAVKTTKDEEEEEEKQNYYLNMGYAIRTLREELPEVFHRELTLDIYRDDIVFKDPLNTFIGIQNYKSILWALRFHGWILFRALWVDIISVWQPVEDVVMIRWTVHGVPRVIMWESRGRFDGTSEYRFDKKGKILEHKVDNIAFNSPPKFKTPTMEELIQSVSCPSSPKPTYFEMDTSFFSSSQGKETSTTGMN